MATSKNGGTDVSPERHPPTGSTYTDFEDKKLGKVVPYGVYDVTADAGFVSVGIMSDTAEFAVASIRCWHDRMGRARYPKARELTITADGGGSNGARVRLWKVELQKLADANRARHRVAPLSARHVEVEQDRAPAVLRHHAELARRGRSQIALPVVELIGATTNQNRFESRKRARYAQLPEGHPGQQRRDERPRHHRRSVRIRNWNYTIKPRRPSKSQR